MSAGKILIVLTSNDKLHGEEFKDHKTGFYLPELAHAWYEFKRAGYELVTASPKGGKSPLDESSVKMFKDDPECKQFLEDAEAQKYVDNTKKLSEIDPKASEFKAIFYPGGHGPALPHDLPGDAHSQEIIKNVFESGRPVSAVCHAPAVLTDVKLSDDSYILKGRKATAFTNVEEEQAKMTKALPWLVETRMTERGATFEKADPWAEKVVVDKDSQGRTLITGQNPASTRPLAKAVIEAIQASA